MKCKKCGTNCSFIPFVISNNRFTVPKEIMNKLNLNPHDYVEATVRKVIRE